MVQIRLTSRGPSGIVARLTKPDLSKPVANTSQSRKRARQAETHRQRNAGQRSAMRTAIKRVVAAIDAGDGDGAKAALAASTPVLDRAVTHGLIHKNKAARHKSRLHKRVKALG